MSSVLYLVELQSTAVVLGKLGSLSCALFNTQSLSVDGLHIIAQLKHHSMTAVLCFLWATVLSEQAV